MTAAIATFVAVWLWREKRRDDTIALALVLGGALGNILDRSRLGYVVDFADLHFGEWRPFLVFNVGDAAITIGVLLLLVRALLMRESKARQGKLSPPKEITNMRLSSLLLAATAGTLLAGCAGGGPLNRARPDEFAVARNPQLVVPPDYALTPPAAGQADPGDPRSQALQALFGGPQPRSAVENNLLQLAGADQAACRRPLDGRRSGDHGRQPRRAGSDDPAAAAGRRPGSLGLGPAIGCRFFSPFSHAGLDPASTCLFDIGVKVDPGSSPG